MRSNLLMAALSVVSVLAVANGAAAETPLPETDFSGTWVVQDEGGNELHAKMNYSATEGAMRMQASPGGMEMSTIRDMKTGEMVVWTSQMPGMGMRVKTPAEPDLHAEPTGTSETLNGETCEVWRIKDGTACLADGNIPIRTEVKGTTAELRDLKREPQDAALFEPPSDLTIMSLPSIGGMIKGLDLPNLPF